AWQLAVQIDRPAADHSGVDAPGALDGNPGRQSVEPGDQLSRDLQLPALPDHAAHGWTDGPTVRVDTAATGRGQWRGQTPSPGPHSLGDTESGLGQCGA